MTRTWRCPLMTDAVDKVGDEQRAGNNRIQVPSFLNRYCVPDSYLDSMLLTRPSKNVYRQRRSPTEVTAAHQAAFWVAVAPAFLALGLLIFSVHEPGRLPQLRKVCFR
jgi:hypothetical protein